jgi:hypothetical protein
MYIKKLLLGRNYGDYMISDASLYFVRLARNVKYVYNHPNICSGMYIFSTVQILLIGSVKIRGNCSKDNTNLPSFSRVKSPEDRVFCLVGPIRLLVRLVAMRHGKRQSVFLKQRDISVFSI